MQAGGPPLLIGGNVAATFRRIVEFGAGWILGAGGPQAFADGVDKARRAPREAGCEGAPRLVAIAYVSLGEDAEGHAQQYLDDYYGSVGDFVEQIVAGALTSQQQVADAVTASKPRAATS